MVKQVKILWKTAYAIWDVKGKDEEEIIEKCWKLVYKYHAEHFEVLD